MDLGRIEVQRKTGGECFHQGQEKNGPTLLNFWQWSCSDLVSNVTRGMLAEFLVASALGVADGVRAEWDSVDIRTPDGLKVEVKASSYLQSWQQNRLSTISFDIGPARGWDAATNTTSEEIKRNADVYVFCLLKHKEQNTLDPMDLDQWTFYVLPTWVLNQSAPAQKTIGLNSLQRLGPTETRYATLREVVLALGEVGDGDRGPCSPESSGSC